MARQTGHAPSLPSSLHGGGVTRSREMARVVRVTALLRQLEMVCRRARLLQEQIGHEMGAIRADQTSTPTRGSGVGRRREHGPM